MSQPTQKKPKNKIPTTRENIRSDVWSSDLFANNCLRLFNEIVFGILNGFYYMKQCTDECFKLGLCGWVKSTRRGTIVGIIQGPKSKICQMISWLTNSGSPGSRITDCKVYNYRYLPKQEYRGFSLRI